MAAARRTKGILVLLMGILFTSSLHVNAYARKAAGVDDVVPKVSIGGSTLQMSNANHHHVSGKWDRHNKETDLSVESDKPNGGHIPQEVEDAGLVSTADYWAPRHHPPKNN